MPLSISLIPGPLTSEMTREAAETALRNHPGFSKDASVQLEQLEGRWIAAIVKEAGPPFGGAPADSDSDAPGPKSEGPDDTAPEPDGDEGPSPSAPSDGDGDEGPPKKEKGGEKGELDALKQMVEAIATALGVPLDIGGMAPGPDDGMGGAGPDLGGPPPGAGGPPGAPPGGPAGPPGPDQKIVHQRALKPGEAPPGTTPLGSPAFSSVDPNHPWAHQAGVTPSFLVSDRIGERPLVEVQDELHQLASGINYRVARFAETVDDEGYRSAEAVITAL